MAAPSPRAPGRSPFVRVTCSLICKTLSDESQTASAAYCLLGTLILYTYCQCEGTVKLIQATCTTQSLYRKIENSQLPWLGPTADHCVRPTPSSSAFARTCKNLNDPAAQVDEWWTPIEQIFCSTSQLQLGLTLDRLYV